MVALWSRLSGFRKEALTRAFVDGSVVKAQTLRITLHVSTAADYPDLLAASMDARPGRISPSVRGEPLGEWPHNRPSASRAWHHALPDPSEAAVRVVRAYLTAYGPATRKARAPADAPAPVRFLPAFDSIILAHRDRSRIVPAEYVDAVFNKKNATTKNTFTVDGLVAGAWRIEKRSLVVEPFAPLPVRWRREVDAEGERLLAWYLS